MNTHLPLYHAYHGPDTKSCKVCLAWPNPARQELVPGPPAGRRQQEQQGQASSLHTAGSLHQRPSVSSQAAVSTPAARSPPDPRRRSVKRPHPVNLKLEQGVSHNPLPPASQSPAPQPQARLPGDSGPTNQSQRPQVQDLQANQRVPGPQPADQPGAVQHQQPLPSNTARSAPARSQPVSSRGPAGRSAAALGGAGSTCRTKRRPAAAGARATAQP